MDIRNARKHRGNLFGIGANSFISRSLGQGNRENAAKASTFAFYGALGGVLVIMSTQRKAPKREFILGCVLMLIAVVLAQLPAPKSKKAAAN